MSAVARRSVRILAVVIGLAGAMMASAATLTVSKSGSGTGLVTGSPGAINCGATCEDANVADGTMVTLTASGLSGSQFTGWLGPCTGTGTCGFKMNGDTKVEATFAVAPYASATLDIDASGGCDALTDGLVASRFLTGVAGAPLINGGLASTATRTGATDVENYLIDIRPALDIDGNGQADPSTDGLLIVRYLSGLRGSSLTADALGPNPSRSDPNDIATQMIALCTPPPIYTLTVTKSGNGGGTVTSAPAGIACGADCDEQYVAGTQVVLTATPDGSSTFSGWSGACAGTGTCTIAMNAVHTVDAAFALAQQTLTVTTTGNGAGTVTSNPAGINCGATCSAMYPPGTVVTLTATASTGTPATESVFVGWSGACSGTGSCMLTMNSSLSASARFDLKPNIAFVSGVVSGNTGGLAGANATCQTNANASGLTGTFKAYLSSSTTSALSQLAGASGWVRVDGKPIAGSASDFASGRYFYPLRLTSAGVDVGDVAVMTATTNGAQSGSGSCADYTSTSGSITVGTAAGQSTMASNFGSLNCTASMRMYCVGVDRAAAVQISPVPARRLAFVTSVAWTPSGGLLSADALCQNEASAASLPGTFRALLATSTATAASRFNTAGLPWGRVDGALLASTAAAAMSGTLWDTSPGLSANGSKYFGNSGVWGGAANLTTVGTVAQTCSNWTSTAGTGTAGRAGFSSIPGFVGFDSADPCSTNSFFVACFQQ